MKLNDTPDAWGSRVISEGKILEIMPVIFTPIGEPLMLPPITYKVPNWFLGFRDNHYIGLPINLGNGSTRMHIPGTVSNESHRMEVWARILEDSDVGIEQATVTREAMEAFIAAFKDAQRGDDSHIKIAGFDKREREGE